MFFTFRYSFPPCASQEGCHADAPDAVPCRRVKVRRRWRGHRRSTGIANAVCGCVSCHCFLLFFQIKLVCSLETLWREYRACKTKSGRARCKIGLRQRKRPTPFHLLCDAYTVIPFPVTWTDVSNYMMYRTTPNIETWSSIMRFSDHQLPVINRFALIWQVCFRFALLLVLAGVRLPSALCSSDH